MTTSESLAETVVAQLRERILDGSLAPGSRIRQEEIARSFGTSRHPVREALRTLAGEGFVTLEPYVGARVASMDLHELIEVYLIRERLEPLALSDSVRHITEERVVELQRLVGEMERVGDEGDRMAWLALDTEFHLILYRAAALPRLLRLIEGLLDRAQQFRRAYLTSFPHSLGVSQVEHRLLLDAIERHAAEDAEALLQVHIRRTRLALTEFLQEQSRSAPAAGKKRERRTPRARV